MLHICKKYYKMKKINSKLFKLAMSKFATGVTVISINKNHEFIGKTVNSFAALSLDPPLVLFSLDKKSTSLRDFKKSSFLGINFLSKNQKNLSKYFSTKKPSWKDISYVLSKNKTPLIKHCVTNIDCKIVKLINQGDHTIFICEICFVNIDEKKKPLIYVSTKYI
jgi:flavin reductase (DIM6/NTAB) family NADH-FMN oxidoreductase RutF